MGSCAPPDVGAQVISKSSTYTLNLCVVSPGPQHLFSDQGPDFVLGTEIWQDHGVGPLV